MRDSVPSARYSSICNVIESTDSMIQWNLIITVTLGPNLSGCYIEVAFLLSGILVYINTILKFEAYSSVFTAQTTGLWKTACDSFNRSHRLVKRH